MGQTSRLPWLAPAGRVPAVSSEVDRRRPDRRIFVIVLLRRITVYALVASALIWGGPRLLVEFGLLGPSVEETIAGTQHALDAARTYGATPELPAFGAAQKELDRARELGTQGHGRQARHAALHARELAVEAQRAAIVHQDETRRLATVAYKDLDRQIGDLEKLYAAVTPGLEKEKVGELLSLMKVTRSVTGTLFLAYEQENYGAVVEGEGRGREAVAQMRARLEAARK
jgi:hypothetical protein